MRLIIFISSMLLNIVGHAVPAKGSGQHIVIDTDIFGDVDDVGALTIANILHNCGLAEIKGIAINTHSKYGAPAASAICSYFGNGDVPIAAIRPLTDATFFDNWTFQDDSSHDTDGERAMQLTTFSRRGEYASKIGYNYPGNLTHASLTQTPLELYRSVLSSAENQSLHIISIGFLTNLADLIRSTADHISPLSGVELLRAKVKKLIVMGGEYPSGWEYNFGGVHPKSTIYVIDHWPKSIPITFSGYELGGNVYSGLGGLPQAPADSPVLAAYEWYVTRNFVDRETWDPITTLYGILGLDGFAKIGMQPLLRYANEYGYNSIVTSNGSNAWVNDTKVRNQHWLELADGVANTSMARLIDHFLVHPPAISTCLV